MIKHIVMFKLCDTNGKSEYENAAEAKERFNDVLKNVPQIKKGAYQVHPAHKKFGQFISTVKISRACIDYEF